MTAAGLEFDVDTFFGHRELSALHNLHRCGRLVSAALGHVLDLVHDVVALKDLAKDDVTAVEPAGDCGRDEELAAVGVFAGVGHACGCLAAVLV